MKRLACAILALLVGCDSVSRHEVNAVTPGGTLAFVPQAFDEEPLRGELLDEVDAAAPPRPYAVILHREGSSSWRWGENAGATLYGDDSPREIHLVVEPEAAPGFRLPALEHEVEHAHCECWCVDYHAWEDRCR